MNTKTDYSDWSDDELYSTVSDFYKDINGIRPRWVYGDREAAIELYESLINQVEAQRNTFEGREQLREDGFVVAPETDPELIQRAAWLQAERDKRKARFHAFMRGEDPAQQEHPMDRVSARQYVENGFV